MISNILNQGAEVTMNLRNSTPRILLHDYNGYDKCKMQEGSVKVKV